MRSLISLVIATFLLEVNAGSRSSSYSYGGGNRSSGGAGGGAVMSSRGGGSAGASHGQAVFAGGANYGSQRGAVGGHASGGNVRMISSAPAPVQGAAGAGRKHENAPAKGASGAGKGISPAKGASGAGKGDAPAKGASGAGKGDAPAQGASGAGKGDAPAQGASGAGKENAPAQGASGAGKGDAPAQGASGAGNDDAPVQGASGAGNDDAPVQGSSGAGNDDAPVQGASGAGNDDAPVQGASGGEMDQEEAPSNGANGGSTVTSSRSSSMTANAGGFGGAGSVAAPAAGNGGAAGSLKGSASPNGSNELLALETNRALTTALNQSTAAQVSPNTAKRFLKGSAECNQNAVEGDWHVINDKIKEDCMEKVKERKEKANQIAKLLVAPESKSCIKKLNPNSLVCQARRVMDDLIKNSKYTINLYGNNVVEVKKKGKAILLGIAENIHYNVKEIIKKAKSPLKNPTAQLQFNELGSLLKQKGEIFKPKKMDPCGSCLDELSKKVQAEGEGENCGGCDSFMELTNVDKTSAFKTLGPREDKAPLDDEEKKTEKKQGTEQASES